MRKAGYVGTRWLGVGLASVLAVVTLGLAVTGRLSLYINPDSAWFAVTMSLAVLVGAVASFALPLGAEADHGHDHGAADDDTGHRRDHDHGNGHDHGHDGSDHAHDRGDGGRDGRSVSGRKPLATAAVVAGGVVATGVVLAALLLPPASLSAELAMSRDVGAPPLFAGQDAVALAATGDTASFGVGEWSTVFATAANPDAFDGDPVTLTGFVTPGDDFALTRLVITHCVIDAQPASVSVTAPSPTPDTGQWVTVSGTVRSSPDGTLRIEASSVEVIPEPEDPYEY